MTRTLGLQQPYNPHGIIEAKGTDKQDHTVNTDMAKDKGQNSRTS